MDLHALEIQRLDLVNNINRLESILVEEDDQSDLENYYNELEELDELIFETQRNIEHWEQYSYSDLKFDESYEKVK